MERLRLLLILALDGLVDEVLELQSRLLLLQLVRCEHPVIVRTVPEISSLAQRVSRVWKRLIVSLPAMELSWLVYCIVHSFVKDWVLAEAVERPAVLLVDGLTMDGSEVGGGQGSMTGVVLQPGLSA